MSAARRHSVSFVAVALLGAIGLTSAYYVRLALAEPPPRGDQWRKVEEAVNKGLPKTAIQELEPIIASALKDKAYPEAVKAVAKKIALEGTIQGNKPEERVTRMKAEIARAPKEMVPTMEALLAHWYWHYFQHNRWRFVQRTATAAPPGEDFTTWDLPRLFREIDDHFTKALANAPALKAIPIADYNALLEKGNLPDAYRPTLYDFLAFEALNFYSSAEQAGAKAEDAFEVDAGGPALAPADEFLKWKPETTDATSRKLKAIRLFQSLLNFHTDDADKTAYLDADLFRLQFAYNQALGEEKSARYKSALSTFADAHKAHELSATALARLAQVIHDEGDKVEARKIAERAVAAFPESRGGKTAYNLIRQIEAKEVNVQAERVWTDPLPTIQVRYRNITKVHFRLIRSDWTARLGNNRFRPEHLTDQDRAQFLAQRPDVEFSADLPATIDYDARTHDVPVPKDLKPGFYFLFASPDGEFQTRDNPISATDVWVSDLAAVVRTEQGAPRVEGFVLKAKSGEPIAGAKVKTWTRDNNNRLSAGETVETDKNGLFRVATQNDPRGGRRLLLLATHGEQELAAQQDFYGYQNPHQPRPTGQTVLFTDRSLYRPGQTIHFKGICLRADQEADKYETLPNKAVNLRFLDVNGQEVAKLAAKTNDYGSFAGSFTAPRGALTGHMTLVAGDDVPGSVGISVEEYKRPQFLVELDAPKEPAKLNGEVKLTGKATAYTGAAVGGAKVKYRVVREVRYPPWFHDFYWWRMPPNRGASQEIAHGSAVTNPDGSFPIAFVAKPDKTVPEKDEPTFRFTVTADVTDTNGETRSADRTVNVGYTALQAILAADDWQATGQDVKFVVATTTLDGEGQAAKGTVKVHRLKQPEQVQRPDIQGARPLPRRGRGAEPVAPGPDPANPKTWELGEVAATLPFTTDAAGKAELSAKLDDGAYRAVLETADKFDKPVTAREQVTVLNPDAKELKVKVPHLFAAPKWTLEPGQEFRAVWGTGYDAGRAFIEIEHRNKLVQAYWTDAGRTQAVVKQAIDEGMRGGFTVRATYVRENRAYLESKHVDVPWTNKQLTLKWERFVSKLEPGKKETWTAVVSGPDAQGAVAEMVAALYDQSLDAFKPHDWMKRFNVFRQDRSNKQSHFENAAKHLGHVAGGWQHAHKPIDPMVYRSFPADLTANLWGYMFAEGMALPGPGGGGAMPRRAALPAGAPVPTDGARFAPAERGLAKSDALTDSNLAVGTPPAVPRPPAPDLSQVTARTNLVETAFFFPHLVSDDSGTVRLEFTMPEALTKWKFLGFAHDNQLRSGFLGGEAVTAKDLMVQPNPPRFLREGDVLEFAVKVTNQSPERQAGTVRLTFADARTGKPVDAELGNAQQDQPFDIPPKEARSFTWRITVPDGLGPITYKAVGAAGKFSDGEEGGLPVLSKRVLVTESLPLPIRGAQTKTFEFTKLLESGKSDTIKHQALTVQMTSNPAWYAVQALPYLMEYPYECSEQTFNRLYANALARHVAASDPKIRKVFDQWKNTPALDSPLEKNPDLKSAMLEETPWVRAARDESQAKRNVGILFDENRLDDETTRLMRKIADMQLEDGSWPWFPGGPKNDYITLYIATGYGRLRHLGVKVDVSPAVKAVARLDAWADEVYRRIPADKRHLNHLSSTIALYLYGRSFFLGDRPPAPPHQEAIAYWQNQARTFWLKLANRQSQAHLALALARFGHADDAKGIAASIKERSVSNEELGMFWRDTELSWWWYHAPIETQAVMIELFAEVADDPKSVEDCKVWLLKQKQTQNWKTTKATADAVYALLLRGDNLLKSDALVTVTLGAQKLTPEKVEAGTGFYEEKFVRGEVKPEMGKLTVTKTDPGVAWGGVHWQYLEDLSKVTPHEGTPLKLEKSVYKKTLTKTGPVIEEVKGPVQVGDELVMRVVLRTDRDMEYVHLKDHRGSGTEPVNVLSRYRFQDGLAYYESTKDTASHFFIDYLPKGTYVFEYSVRAVHKGKYPTGLASIQCMYAPEFNSHSGSVMLEVK